MGKTVTATYSIVYDTQEEYDEDLANLGKYESDADKPDSAEPALDEKTLEEGKLTLNFKVTKRVEKPEPPKADEAE